MWHLHNHTTTIREIQIIEAYKRNNRKINICIINRNKRKVKTCALHIPKSFLMTYFKTISNYGDESQFWQYKIWGLIFYWNLISTEQSEPTVLLTNLSYYNYGVKKQFLNGMNKAQGCNCWKRSELSVPEVSPEPPLAV